MEFKTVNQITNVPLFSNAGLIEKVTLRLKKDDPFRQILIFAATCRWWGQKFVFASSSDRWWFHGDTCHGNATE